ncbi:MAG: hypothetical protein AAF352_03685, partial [Pseudomonadota bacterium]
VDFFATTVSRRMRIWLDMMASLLCILPFCTLASIAYFPYVVRAWHLQEASQEYAGLPLVFLLKTIPMVGFLFLGLQSLRTILHALLRLNVRHLS